MTVQIASTARISKFADIEPSIRGTRVTIGENTVIDSFVKIKPAGGNGDVVIGDNVVINSGCVIYSGNGLTIGNGVAIAANCVFAPTNHAYMDRDTPIREQGFLPSRGGIVIEDDVWIGAGCVFLDGSIVRKGAVIGAMSLVRGEVEAYTVCYGQPLRVLTRRK